MIRDHGFEPSEFMRLEAQIPRQSYGIQPELGTHVISINVDMRRLVRVVAVEVEAEGSFPENRRHLDLPSP